MKGLRVIFFFQTMCIMLELFLHILQQNLMINSIEI